MPQNDVTTSFVRAFAGMEPDNSFSADNYISRVSNETLLQIPFGHVVMDDTAAYGTGCKLMAAQAGTMLGIVPYANAYQVGHELGVIADTNGNLGVLPGTNLTIKKRGKLWVAIDENVDPSTAVRVRTSSVSSHGPGNFRKTALATHTVDISKFAKWAGTYLAADGFGLLEYDFTMSANALADS